MVRVKLKPAPTQPGCRQCRDWIAKMPKLSGADPNKLHEKVCEPAITQAEARKSLFFTIGAAELKRRESERLLTMLFFGLKDDPAEKSPKPALESIPKSSRPLRPPPPKSEARNTRQPGQTGQDSFGFRLGTGAAIINTGITGEWKTAERIAKDSKSPRSVFGHLAKMVEIGYCEKRGTRSDAQFRLSPKGLALKK